MSIVQETKKKMDAAIEHLKEELRGLRTGRAAPGLLENCNVEAYGSLMKLRDLASVTAPEARQLLVTPYAADTVEAISKGIQKEMGFMPQIEGKLLRVNIPPLDKDAREKMVKLCWKYCEDGKVSVRNVRRDSNDRIKKDKEVPEDLRKKLQNDIQKLTDDACKAADELAKDKEKEISTI